LPSSFFTRHSAVLFSGGAQKRELLTQPLSVARFVRINRDLVFPRDLGTPTLDRGHVRLPSGETPEIASKCMETKQRESRKPAFCYVTGLFPIEQQQRQQHLHVS
jgi:hypothetical protein